MPGNRFEKLLADHVAALDAAGGLKGLEKVITGVRPPKNGKGPRYTIAGFDRPFLRMNANAYLGLGRENALIKAEEEAVRAFGVGPGAVRFISGTFTPHIELEQRLARFHEREAAMIFSSAYATIMGLLPSLIDGNTAIISDALNHNSIINAVRLSRPKSKAIYAHLDMTALESQLEAALGAAKRVVIITDGIFSMRGDYAPLDTIVELASRYDDKFADGVITVVDDSHGVGAFGKSGRGTIEYTGADGIDILVGTLGKAFGVNGGYLVASKHVVNFLRETAPFYIYSNPITPGEAAAAIQALDIIDSADGKKRLAHLREMTGHFEQGLLGLGFEVIQSEHPVVPLMIRDGAKTRAIVQHLVDNGILATGLSYPVVPKGDEEIRFQVSAEHTQTDIDEVLDVLKQYLDGDTT